MRFQTTDTAKPSISMTPLIDVVFLLLMFFVLTSTFDRERAIDVQLPQASEQDRDINSQPNGQVQYTISMAQDGQIGFQGKTYPNASEPALRRAIQAALKQQPHAAWSLRADRNSRHGQVTQLMQMLAELGLDDLAIQTLQTTAQQP